MRFLAVARGFLVGFAVVSYMWLSTYKGGVIPVSALVGYIGQELMIFVGISLVTLFCALCGLELVSARMRRPILPFGTQRGRTGNRKDETRADDERLGALNWQAPLAAEVLTDEPEVLGSAL